MRATLKNVVFGTGVIWLLMIQLFCPLSKGVVPPLAENAASSETQGPKIIFHTSEGDIRYALEIADTPAKQEKGLMSRESLGESQGMLFIFGALENHAFWMENTLIPLDMIFMNDRWQVIGIISNAKPLSRELLNVGKPSLYVLEINGGNAKKYGIQIGASATYYPSATNP